jgi:hypothetical protein
VSSSLEITFDVAVAVALATAAVAAATAAVAAATAAVAAALAIVWLRVIIFVCSYYIRTRCLINFSFVIRNNYYIFMQSHNYI